MQTSNNLLHESMYQNAEAPFFDCSKFKSFVKPDKARLGLLERLNAWCDNFTMSKRTEIFHELESLKHPDQRS